MEIIEGNSVFYDDYKGRDFLIDWQKFSPEAQEQLMENVEAVENIVEDVLSLKAL